MWRQCAHSSTMPEHPPPGAVSLSIKGIMSPVELLNSPHSTTLCTLGETVETLRHLTWKLLGKSPYTVYMWFFCRSVLNFRPSKKYLSRSERKGPELSGTVNQCVFIVWRVAVFLHWQMCKRCFNNKLPVYQKCNNIAFTASSVILLEWCLKFHLR